MKLSGLPTKVAAKVAHGRFAEPVYTARRAVTGRGVPPSSGVSRSLAQTMVATTSLDDITTADWRATAVRLHGTLAGAMKPVGDFDVTDGRSTALHTTALQNRELLTGFPELLQWGTAPLIIDLVRSYFRVPIALTDIVARLDHGTGQQVGTRIWHLDTEDVRVIRMIAYLTDVSISDGPFEYLDKRTTACLTPQLRERALRAKGNPILDDELRGIVEESAWCQALGPAGTVFLADNAHLLHHGRIHSSQRLAVFFTYTTTFPRFPVLEPSVHALHPIVRIPGLDESFAAAMR